ncbi:MAG: hypothetical protein SV062_08220 [Thermodesulfobacteriota bacterium]|nr:hypothetical protein [Thermodesulfobacteriota bacterium]
MKAAFLEIYRKEGFMAAYPLAGGYQLDIKELERYNPVSGKMEMPDRIEISLGYREIEEE